ncbi:MAG: FHA domain-containing protein [Gemmatimonadaceae bacterium]
MARVRVVEILDARGHVRSRTRLDTIPASIGRAFDNDIIVDDPFVSPHHLRLVEDDAGVLWMEDVGSKNGTRRAFGAAPETRFATPSGSTVVLGRTMLRIFDTDHAVPDAVLQHAEETSIAELLGNPRHVAIAAGACVLLFAARGYLESTSREVAESIVTMPLGVLFFVVLWAGVWALIGRVTRAGGRFVAHFAWACVGLVVLTLLAMVLGWIEFAIPSSDFLSALSAVVLAAAFAVYLTGHVTLASSLSARLALRRTVIGFGAAAIVSVLLVTISREEFSVSPSYPTALAPLPTALLQTEEIDEFAAETLELQKEVDELARKRERASFIPNSLKGR